MSEGAFEVAMRTQGEIESAIGEGISRFEQDYMGRGPQNIHTYLLGDLVKAFGGASYGPEKHENHDSQSG